jgi:hypothetical protein
MAADQILELGHPFRYLLFDTNAISTVLKDPYIKTHISQNYIAKGWLPVFHPINELELTNCSLIEAFYVFVSDTKCAFPLSPDEVRKLEIDNYPSGARIDPIAFIQKTGFDANDIKEMIADGTSWRDEAFAGFTSLHDNMVESAQVALNVTNDRKAFNIAKNAMYWKLEADGFKLERKTDLFRFPALMSETLAIAYKYLQKDRQTKVNDLSDLQFFYLVPYVNLFVTERNNATICRQIKRSMKLENFEVLTLSELLKMGRA